MNANLDLYEVDPDYVDYLSQFAEHLFHNSQSNQKNSRKYIGIVLTVNGFDYFVPLSSYKDKHQRMSEGLDFIKIKKIAVLNINNMIPVPKGLYRRYIINDEPNPSYRILLIKERRYIKSISDKIRSNAKNLYNLKVNLKIDNPLTRRCNDFILLEKKCREYNQHQLKSYQINNG